MATRYIGSAKITMRFKGSTPCGDQYTGVVKAGDHKWRFTMYYVTPVYVDRLSLSYNKPEAYDMMAAEAIDNSSHCASADVAEAIKEATFWGRGSYGTYNVRRRA